MIKEYYSRGEVSELWGCSRQYIAKIQDKLGKLKVEGDARHGKVYLIPLQSLFYGNHKDLVIWDEPYKDGDKWKIKSYDINGLHEHDIS